MKNLTIIRHAKSDWNSPSGDYGRPITERGKKDAKSVATIAKEFIQKSTLIWSSNAKRAAQTTAIFSEVFNHVLKDVIFKEELYTFDGNTLEKIIKSCDNQHNSLIVFGHNEAITDFVNKFGDIFIDNVPTSGFVSINFDTDEWHSIANGKTTKVIFPRDLKS